MWGADVVVLRLRRLSHGSLLLIQNLVWEDVIYEEIAMLCISTFRSLFEVRVILS